MESTNQWHPNSEALLKFVSDELEAQQSNRIATHLEECPECQAELDRLGRQAEPLIDELKKLPSENLVGVLISDSSTSTDLELNGQFEVAEQIAEGGMGVVYRGYDQELRRDVAIKIMPHQTDDSQQATEMRFQREARLSGQLQHPGIVPIHKLGKLNDGRSFIAMKLVAGETLAKLISNRESHEPLTPLLDVFGQVCRTMAYAHAQGIIHRDLKPNNIMVGPFGEVQVMDWGLAKKLNDDSGESDIDSAEYRQTSKIVRHQSKKENLGSDFTAQGSILGTPAYMPPEQANGDPNTSTPADVFSLGGILCEILTGAPPYVADLATDAHKLAQKGDLQETFARLDECSAGNELVELTRDCLRIEADERPPTAEEVNQRFQEIGYQQAERLRKSELNRAATEAKLVVETKRRKQIALLSSLVAGVLIIASIATGFYFSEKAARQADQFEQQREESEAIRKREREVRAILQSARQLEQEVVLAPETEQPSLWSNVLVETNKAEGLLQQTDSPELFKEFESFRSYVVQASNTAESRRRNRIRDVQARRDIKKAILDTRVPDRNMRMGPTREIFSSFEQAFANFGIQKQDNIRQVADEIRNSDARDALILGLHEWHNQFVWITPYSEEIKTREWFQDLMDEVDSSPLRTKLRRLARERKFKEIMTLAEQPKAIDHLLTVTIMFRTYFRPSKDERQAIGEDKWTQMLSDYLERAYLEHPDSFLVNFELGHFKRRARKFQESMRHWYACRALEPDHLGVANNLVTTLRQMDQFDEALATSRKLWEKHPDNPIAINAIIVSCSLLHKNEEGLKYARLCTEKFPDYRNGHFNRQVMATRLELWPEAIASANRVLEFDREHVSGHAYLSMLHEAAGQYQQALPFAKTYYEKAPRSGEAMTRLANLYDKLGEPTKSIEFYEEAIEVHPENKHYKLTYCTMLVERGDFARVDELLAVIEPSNPHQDLMKSMLQVRSYEGQGRIDEAATLASEFFRKNPKAVSPFPLTKPVKDRVAELQQEDIERR